MLIKAALNGGRSRSEHPAIPITPQELASSAKEAVAAGAGFTCAAPTSESRSMAMSSLLL